MNLKTKLLNFLVTLPKVDSPDKRKALVTLAGISHLGIYLDWEGANMEFFPRLLDELAKRGKATLVQFLQNLSELTYVQGVERQTKVNQFRQAVEALSEEEWQTQFAVAEPVQAEEKVLDVDMLAMSVVSTVLTPYFKLGKDGLQQEAGAGAVRLAEKVWKKVQAAVEDVPGGSVTLRFYPKDPEDAQADLVSLLRDQLKVDRALALDLADQLASAEAEDEVVLRIIINVAQQVGAVSGSLVGAILGTDALPQVSRVNVDQDIDTVDRNANVVGAVVGNTGSGSAGGDFVGRDKHVGGDEVQGDKIGGDRIDVGNIAGSSGVAIGRGAYASVSHGDEYNDAPVDRSDRRQYDNRRIETGGGAYVGGNASAGDDFVGRDQIQNLGVKGENISIHSLVIHQGSSQTPPAASPTEEGSLIEEQIRLDVAAPPQAILEEPFDLAVAVRQPQAPPLTIEDLTEVESAEGSIFRREKDDIVVYRIKVSASECTVEPPFYQLRLRPQQNSRSCFFQITPLRPGIRSIIVSAHQEDESLAAQTRLQIEITVPVQESDTRSSADKDIIAALFDHIYQHIDCRPLVQDVARDEIEETTRKIQEEVQKGDAANEQKIERWLKNLKEIAPDVLEVTAALLVNPVAGVAEGVCKVAARFRAQV